MDDTTAETTITVRPACGDDIRLAGLTAAIAMHDDPLAGDLAPEHGLRQAALACYYTILAGHAHNHGGRVDVVDGAGYAIWIPSRALALLPTDQLRSCCYPHGDAFDRIAAALGAAHPDEPDHWYLALIVVAPDRQRRGTGDALLRHGCEAADRDGLPAYLEATTETTARWYARHGFEPANRPIRIGQATLRPMWRDLHAGQAT